MWNCCYFNIYVNCKWCDKIFILLHFFVIMGTTSLRINVPRDEHYREHSDIGVVCRLRLVSLVSDEIL